MTGFTMLPNEIIDQAHDMSAAEFKVTVVIYRLIIGYSQYRETGQREISLTELAEITGYSRQGVVNAINEIEQRGFLSRVVQDRGKPNIWVVNSVDQGATKPGQGSQLSVPVPVNSVDYLPTKLVNSVDYPSLKEIKKEKKEEEKETPSPLSDSDWQEIIKLSDWWCSFIGRGNPSPTNAIAKEKHFRPLALLWARVQDTGQCKLLLQEKYNDQIRAGYNPSWPSAVVPQIFGDLSAREIGHENGNGAQAAWKVAIDAAVRHGRNVPIDDWDIAPGVRDAIRFIGKIELCEMDKFSETKIKNKFIKGYQNGHTATATT
jgi:hypothetical protein